jgi:predicted pyridoxine 5'-phosphate oxidase superfamily flavin-nucleotide-binding protein
MGRVYDRLDNHLRDWIARQSLFFVGTAPASLDGHVNVSPKGPIGALRVLDAHTVAYLDIVGSGAETIAHLRENGRIVVMLCAFEGPPRILRMHGRGEVITARDPRFAELLDSAEFDQPAAPQARRAIIVVHLDRIADSCGYGVPLMRHEGERPHSDAWAAKKLRVGGEDALTEYQREKNTVSLDGLPALEPDELKPEPLSRAEQPALRRPV